MKEEIDIIKDLADDHKSASSKSVRLDVQLLSANLPANPSVLESVLQLASDKNIRITKLADTVLRDPVITLEVLSKANTTFSTADKTGIAAVQSAVIRIGSENLVDLFLEIQSREDIDDYDVEIELESLRKLAAKAGMVAEIISSHLQKDIAEAAQTAAILSYTGQMLCCKVLERAYLEISSLKRRTALTFKLQSHFKINLQEIQIQYLKDKGLPNTLFFAYDKELKCKTSAQSSLRFITQSAIEIVEAIEDDKWDKYLSTNTLPTKSSLRLLKISDSIFSIIKEEIEEALEYNAKEKVKESIDDLSLANSEQEEDLEVTAIDYSVETPLAEPIPSNTIVLSRENLLKEIETTPKPQYTRKELSVDSQAIYGLLQYLCQEATSVTGLLKDLMSILTEQGPFTRAAIIEYSSPPQTPLIHSAVGEDFEEIRKNDKLDISDPLSPLSLLAIRIQSYNSVEKDDPCTPFGITSYAISPITSQSLNPLVLYADCGVSRPVPLEARKVFRIVAQLLNDVLPHVSERSRIKRTQNSIKE